MGRKRINGSIKNENLISSCELLHHPEVVGVVVLKTNAPSDKQKKKSYRSKNDAEN